MLTLSAVPLSSTGEPLLLSSMRTSIQQVVSSLSDDQILTISSLLVQISTHHIARLLPFLSEVIHIIQLHHSITYGMKILFWQPLILVVVNSLGWRFFPTKRCCWEEVFVIGIRVRFLMGGWSRHRYGRLVIGVHEL